MESPTLVSIVVSLSIVVSELLCEMECIKFLHSCVCLSPGLVAAALL